MEEKLKQQLHSLYQTYSAIHSQFNRIEREALKLEDERKTVSEILNKTREQEEAVINKLNELLGADLTPNDILEIIKSYEQR